MKKICLYFFIGMMFFSCKNKQGTDTNVDNSDVAEKVSGVCIYDYSSNGLQVLRDYNDPKSHLTYVKLGETVGFLGEVVTEPNSKKEYCKIELSDGTTGWTRKDYIIENTVPAAIMKSTPVYERPDILTKSSKKSYTEIDVVAVIEQKDEWCQVVGRNNLNKGWILKENISLNKEDVGMAILSRKEIFDEKGNLIENKILDFVNNAPFPGSAIVSMLRDKVIENVEEEAAKKSEATDSVPNEELPAWD